MLRVGHCHVFKTGSDVEAARVQVSGESCVCALCCLPACLPVCVRLRMHAGITGFSWLSLNGILGADTPNLRYGGFSEWGLVMVFLQQFRSFFNSNFICVLLWLSKVF